MSPPRCILLSLPLLVLACSTPPRGSPEPSPVITPEPSPAPAATRSAALPALPSPPPSASPPDLRLLPPRRCDRRGGRTSSEIPENGRYAASSFGCRFRADGTLHRDPDDNCELACGHRGLCDPGWDGPTCQANLKWFAADADRYGCGARIRVTNPENQRSVVLASLDRGPSCKNVEQKYGISVLDMSRDAMTYLFEGETYGGSDRKPVQVERVAGDTPLGPVREGLTPR
jgi:hypothetical protein